MIKVAEKGTLIVFVYTAGMAIPIKNARVSLLDSKTQDLIGFRSTNEEGLTTAFELETPDTDLSLSPEEAGNSVPFSVVDILITHPMYQKILVKSVQIFPNRESIQNVNMIPLDEFQNPKTTEIIYPITPQNL